MSPTEFFDDIRLCISNGYDTPEQLLHQLLEKVSLAYGKAYFLSLSQPTPKSVGPNALFVPLLSGDKIGTFVVSSKGEATFSEADRTSLLWVSQMVTLLVVQIHNKAKQDRHAAKSIIGTLTYSELTATLSIFKQLENSTLIVLGKFADDHGFSRSIVGNAVRKIEASGAIETRSLGVKGTKIAIINEKLLEELHKLRV